MDTEQSQSSKNTIYIEKVWEDFSKILQLFLGGVYINFLPIKLYPIFKALCLKNPTYPLRCSPNETFSQQEVIFLSYEQLCLSFFFQLFLCSILYSQFSYLYYIHFQQHETQLITPTFLKHFLHLAPLKKLFYLVCFTYYLNGQSHFPLWFFLNSSNFNC